MHATEAFTTFALTKQRYLHGDAHLAVKTTHGTETLGAYDDTFSLKG